jgi:hypothetical protein
MYLERLSASSPLLCSGFIVVDPPISWLPSTQSACFGGDSQSFATSSKRVSSRRERLPGIDEAPCSALLLDSAVIGWVMFFNKCKRQPRVEMRAIFQQPLARISMRKYGGAEKTFFERLELAVRDIGPLCLGIHLIVLVGATCDVLVRWVFVGVGPSTSLGVGLGADSSP